MTSTKRILIEVDPDITQDPARVDHLLQQFKERGFVGEDDTSPELVELAENVYVPGSIDPTREKDLQATPSVIAVWEDVMAFRTICRLGTLKRSRLATLRYRHPMVTFKLEDGVLFQDVIARLEGIVASDRLFPRAIDPELASFHILRVREEAESPIRKFLRSAPGVKWVDPRGYVRKGRERP